MKIRDSSIKIEHLSTSSLVKITYASKEEKTQGGELEDVIHELYLEYDGFRDLKEAIKLTNNLNIS